MTDQHLLSITIVSLLGLFIWSKFRYDALAAGALVGLMILGVIPANQAFDGFAHPAVMTVALVLIISQGLKNSGLTGLVGKLIGGKSFSKFQFLISLMLIAAVLSSFINNIGALAILLPITLNICQKMDWHPSRFLMPLAFACILGGMNTTIGTPPNIIISEYKSTISDSGFNFFDFSYVGLSVTILSILFISIIGNKFIQLSSPMIRIPAIKFLKKSCAPSATATEKSPKPATKGPICIPKISNIIATPITHTKNLDALSSHICIDGVNHELVDRASNIGFTALAKALNIVYTTKALTIFVAMSPATPEIGSINVQIYKATVIGTKPIGFFKAFKISSSIFDSVLAARRLREFIITEIIKPLKSNAKIITPRDEMIAPRLIPRKPLVQSRS